MSLDLGCKAEASPTSQPAHDTPTGSLGIRDFETVKPISKGAFGVVYLCRHKETSEFYAVKVLKKEDVRRKNQFKYVKAEKSIMAAVRLRVCVHACVRASDHSCVRACVCVRVCVCRGASHRLQSFALPMKTLTPRERVRGLFVGVRRCTR